MRKKLSETQREIVIGKDKCKKCRNLLEQSRVYPFSVYCGWCHISMEYEDEIIFHRKDKLDKFIEKLVDAMDKDGKIATLDEYDKIRTELKLKAMELDPLCGR